VQVQWIANRFVRRQGRGTNTVAGLDAAVAANLGERGAAHTRVSTSHRVVQSTGRRGASFRSEARGGGSEADASSGSQIDNKAGRKESWINI
jgi:hypothetical protein